VKKFFSKEKTVLTGNPVRSAILELAENKDSSDKKADRAACFGWKLRGS